MSKLCAYVQNKSRLTRTIPLGSHPFSFCRTVDQFDLIVFYGWYLNIVLVYNAGNKLSIFRMNGGYNTKKKKIAKRQLQLCMVCMNSVYTNGKRGRHIDI